jgi:hypothetical protein
MTSYKVQPETSGTSDENSALLGRSGFVGRFQEDPFSGGILMAVFDGKRLLFRRDTYLQAKLTTAKRIVYNTEDVYLLGFELNFMKSFSPQYRFRGADINITVQKDGTSDSKPSITKIVPTIIAVDVSEREVQDTNEITVGAAASAGPGQSNVSAKQTHNDKTNFTGRRKFHGVIKRDDTAFWRLYEEPESQSGIPSIFRLVTLVQCLEGGFTVRLEVSARIVKWPKFLGLHNLCFNSSFSADSNKRTISPQDQASEDDSKELIRRINEMMEISALDKQNDSKTTTEPAERSNTDDSDSNSNAQTPQSSKSADRGLQSKFNAPDKKGVSSKPSTESAGSINLVFAGGQQSYGRQLSQNIKGGWGKE